MAMPQDLIDSGLYHDIAIALHTVPHRAVSLTLVAQALGAKVVSRRASVAIGIIQKGGSLKKGMSRKMSGVRVRRTSTKGSGQSVQGAGVGVEVEPVTGVDGVGVQVLG